MRTIPANFRTKAEDYYYRVNKAEVAIALFTAVSVLLFTSVLAPVAVQWIAVQAAG